MDSGCQYCKNRTNITYTKLNLCWDCYYDIISSKNKLDWRDSYIDEKMIELDFKQHKNETSRNLANRCKVFVMEKYGDLVSRGHV